MMQNQKKPGSLSSFRALIYFFLLIISVIISFSLSKKHDAALNKYRLSVLRMIHFPALKLESVFYLKSRPESESELEEVKIQLLGAQIQAVTNEIMLSSTNRLLKNNFRQKNIILIAPRYYSSNGFLTEVIFQNTEGHEIAPNMAVISSEGLYGRVYNVQNNSVSIISVFNAFSRIPVYTKTSKVYGMAAGNGLDIAFLYNNLNDTLLIDGEEVVSSGENNLLIPDLPIGKIKKEGEKIYIVPFGKERPPVLGIIQS